jgi:transcriptional regulator GlxA family with amidase domain
MTRTVLRAERIGGFAARARMLRFRRASDLIGSGTSIAQIAAACGYYDQAHLDRDFRDFAGSTPTAYLAARVTFVQDASPAAS